MATPATSLHRVSERHFVGASGLDDDGLRLALAPALTPDGVDDRPAFFRGTVAHPQVLARALVTLADITSTRYFQYAATPPSDPVVTASGDRLRFECFSACHGVYARLDVLREGLGGGTVAYGTTNVDLGTGIRTALSTLGRSDLLPLALGTDDDRPQPAGRAVEMPHRWVTALGNAAELQLDLEEAFTVPAAGARAFLAALPAATGSARASWLSASRGTVRLGARRTPGAVNVAGLHRLSALKRMLTHATGLSVHATQADQGPTAVVLHLLGARLTLGLTDELWRTHSAQGALRAALVVPGVVEHAEAVAMQLGFESALDVAALAAGAGIRVDDVRAALPVLAAAGRVGWDLTDSAFFHRELPDDPDRVDRSNPRLVAARGLVAADAVEGHPEPDAWLVRSTRAPGQQYLVRHRDGWRCTCAWYLRHGTSRGPCKHALAVALATGAVTDVGDAEG